MLAAGLDGVLLILSDKSTVVTLIARWLRRFVGFSSHADSGHEKGKLTAVPGVCVSVTGLQRQVRH